MEKKDILKLIETLLDLSSSSKDEDEDEEFIEDEPVKETEEVSTESLKNQSKSG